ncbi:MAG TPA: hypothetical protein VMZ53_00835 [Kofleriaceae bacterium]|nr:hypothetical protein [Kofleriaceae bacterium]
MPDARPPQRQRLRQLGWLVAIAVAYLYIFPYFPRIQSANELPRAYLVKAIADDHTFAIDKGVATWGGTADVSPSDGHMYSNKAPGSSLVVVPFYWAVSKIAGPPSLATTVWMCRVFGGVIPALLFLWLLWGFLAQYAPDPNVRRLVLIAYALGSMAMTYALLYYSHQLSAVCIGSAWILGLDVANGRRRVAWMAAVGFLAGASVLVDYQAAFAGVPLLVYLIVRMWQRDASQILPALGIAAATAAIPIALLLAYHDVCFGGPLRTGYDASTTFAHFHKQGFLGISKLRGEAFWGSLVKADNGLLVLSPWLLIAIPGGIYLWRRGERGHVLAVIAIVVIYVAFISSIAMWRGGWGVGPRYITVMLPFLLPLVATALEKWRTQDLLFGAVSGTIVAAVAIYSLSSVTFPYWPDSLKNPLYEVTFRLLHDNAVAPNLGSALGIRGVAGIVPYLLCVFGLLAYTLYRAGNVRVLAVAAAVGLAILVAFRFAPLTGPHADVAYKNTVFPAVTK